MGMSERFYQPAVVPLGYLASRTLARWARGIDAARAKSSSGEAPRAPGISAEGWALGACVAMLVLVYQLIPTLVEYGKTYAWNASRRQLSFSLVAHARTPKGPRTYWFAIDRMSKLPDDLVMATTEVGYLSAMNPYKKVIDMAGLNEAAFALEPFDAERLLKDMTPDLVYMPHEDYTKMVANIQSSPSFEGYEYWDKRQLQTNKFGMAIRKDSPYYQQMRDIVAQVRRGGGPRIQVR
jgi:hypothetical protein